MGFLLEFAVCFRKREYCVRLFWSWLSSWLISLHWLWGKIAVSASYLYINTHNAAAVPYYALPWGCEETFKEICFAGVVIPKGNLKKEIGWSHYNILEWQKVWDTLSALLWLVALPVQEHRAICCSHKTLWFGAGAAVGWVVAVPSVSYASCWLCNWRAYAGKAKSAFLASLKISPHNFPLEGMWHWSRGNWCGFTPHW